MSSPVERHLPDANTARAPPAAVPIEVLRPEQPHLGSRDLRQPSIFGGGGHAIAECDPAGTGGGTAVVIGALTPLCTRNAQVALYHNGDSNT